MLLCTGSGGDAVYPGGSGTAQPAIRDGYAIWENWFVSGTGGVYLFGGKSSAPTSMTILFSINQEINILSADMWVCNRTIPGGATYHWVWITNTTETPVYPSGTHFFGFISLLTKCEAINTTCDNCNPGARYSPKYWNGQGNDLWLSGGFILDHTTGNISNAVAMIELSVS